jgi:HEAT repeat protein
MPGGVRLLAPKRSRAELRIAVEQLLARREPPPAKDWDRLGPEAKEMLVQLLDDGAVKRHDALRHRVIATIGELGVRSGLHRLGELLVDGSEKAITRTQSASALGRSGFPEAVALLGRAISDKDDMVRRQTALSLARLERAEAIPYLRALVKDPIGHVAQAAKEKLEAFDAAPQQPTRRRRRT